MFVGLCVPRIFWSVFPLQTESTLLLLPCVHHKLPDTRKRRHVSSQKIFRGNMAKEDSVWLSSTGVSKARRSSKTKVSCKARAVTGFGCLRPARSFLGLIRHSSSPCWSTDISATSARRWESNNADLNHTAAIPRRRIYVHGPFTSKYTR